MDLKNISLSFFIFCFINFFSVVATAEVDRATERKAFLLALSDLKAGRQQSFQAFETHLQNYPLYPYLVYADLAVHIDALDAQKQAAIENFLKTYQNTPLAGHLRTLWLYQLATHYNNWPLFLKIYADPDGQNKPDKALVCYYAEALWKTGHIEAVLQWLDKTLITSPALPEPCLWVLHQAFQQGVITEALIWRKIQEAFRDHQLLLADQWASFLTPAQKDRFIIWKSVYENPSVITRINPQAVIGLPQGFFDTVLLAMLQKLSHKDPYKAVDFLQKLQAHHILFAKDTQAKMLGTVAIDFAQNHDTAARQWFLAVPEKYFDDHLREWQLRAALWNQDWESVKSLIDRLPASLKKQDTWRYWLARALASLHQPDKAKTIYQDLSIHNHFYGQLANLQLKHPALSGIENFKISPDQLNTLEALPVMQRAYELYKMDWLPEARQEWEWAMRHLGGQDYLAAAVLAIRWGWFERAVSTVNLIKGGDSPWGFPLAYRDSVLQHAEKNSLNPAWLFALIRQESAFTPYARSSAGAVGLMQLLPQTAYLVANQLHWTKVPLDLMDAQTNLFLGSYYLKKLLQQFNGRLVWATAAYDAGPYRVKKWLPRVRMADDIWIETIPYDETRHYVKKIMTSMTFYEKALGLPASFSQRLEVL